MKTLDIKEIIEKLNIKETMCNALHEKTGLDKQELMKYYDQIIDNKINNIGKAMQSAVSNPKNVSRLRDLSVDEFIKDNDKIIKDK